MATQPERKQNKQAFPVSLDGDVRADIKRWSARTNRSEAWVTRALIEVGRQDIPAAIRAALQREMDETLRATTDTSGDAPRGAAK